MQKAPIILLATGIVFLIVTVVMGWFVIPSLIRRKITEGTRLVNGTETWKMWSNITVPMFMSYYIFNTTNPHEVSQGGKPIFEEFGPYVYQEKRVKLDMELNDENGTVFFRQPITYFFRPDLSNGTEEDRFTVINAVLVGVTAKGAELNVLEQFALSGIVHIHEEETLFLNLTVSEILFKGRYVPMMKTIEEQTGQSYLHNYTFGMCYPNNGSDDGIFEVKTGVEDSSEFGQVVSWKGQRELHFWNGEACNKISGSDGSMYPPFVGRDRLVQLFVADICRSIFLKYTEDTEYKNITGYKFALPKEIFEDPRINPDNICFCKKPPGPGGPGKNMDGCLKGGVMQVSACRGGVPAVISTPHFLDGSEEYLNQSFGLQPNRSLHLTYVLLEPNTGLILEAHKRIQVNVAVKPNTISGHFSDVPEMIYPILWFDGYVAMTDDTATGLKTDALNPINYAETGKWSLIVISFCFIVAAHIVLLIPSRNQYTTTKKKTYERNNKSTIVMENILLL